MHAHDRGVDHLDCSIVSSGQCVYDTASDTGSPPPDEAVIASGVRATLFRQITPGCSRSQNPEDAIEDAAVVRPWNASWLIRQHLLNGGPFIAGESVAHDSILQFWSLNHGDLAECNALARPPLRRLRAEADVNHLTIPPKSSKMTRSGRVR